MIGPVLFGASSFACADLLSKVTFRAGGDALTVSMLRGVIGLAVLFVWMRFARLPGFIARREKVISLALGIVFAANVFFAVQGNWRSRSSPISSIRCLPASPLP
jgi:hypothetical protein